MSERLVTLERIRRLESASTGRVHRTPMLSSATAAGLVAERTGSRLRDDRLLSRRDHLQKTGSFKARAALSKLTSLSEEEQARGVVTLSQVTPRRPMRGPAPRRASRSRSSCPSRPSGRRSTRPRLRRGGRAPRRARGRDMARVQELIAERGLTLVHPFDDPEVIAGNGTAGWRSSRTADGRRRRRGGRGRLHQRRRDRAQGAKPGVASTASSPWARRRCRSR